MFKFLGVKSHSCPVPFVTVEASKADVGSERGRERKVLRWTLMYS